MTCFVREKSGFSANLDIAHTPNSFLHNTHCSYLIPSGPRRRSSFTVINVCLSLPGMAPFGPWPHWDRTIITRGAPEAEVLRRRGRRMTFRSASGLRGLAARRLVLRLRRKPLGHCPYFRYRRQGISRRGAARWRVFRASATFSWRGGVRY